MELAIKFAKTFLVVLVLIVALVGPIVGGAFLCQFIENKYGIGWALLCFVIVVSFAVTVIVGLATEGDFF